MKQKNSKEKLVLGETAGEANYLGSSLGVACS